MFEPWQQLNRVHSRRDCCERRKQINGSTGQWAYQLVANALFTVHSFENSIGQWTIVPHRKSCLVTCMQKLVQAVRSIQTFSHRERPSVPRPRPCQTVKVGMYAGRETSLSDSARARLAVSAYPTSCRTVCCLNPQQCTASRLCKYAMLGPRLGLLIHGWTIFVLRRVCENFENHVFLFSRIVSPWVAFQNFKWTCWCWQSFLGSFGTVTLCFLVSTIGGMLTFQ